MAQYYDYKTVVVEQDGDIELTSLEIKQLKASSYHQVGFSGGSATAGTITISVKWRGSPDYVALSDTIDISAPVAVQFTGYIDEIKLEASTSDGDYTCQLVGGSFDEVRLSEIGETTDDLVINTRGYTIIDMANDDYQMTALQSLNKNIVVYNVGDGSKTITIFDSPNNPGQYNFISTTGGVFRVSGAGSSTPIFTKGEVIYLYGSGVFNQGIHVLYDALVNATCAANQNNINQLMDSIYLPPGTLSGNGDCINVAFSLRKNGDLNVYNSSLSIDATATAGTNAIWNNNSLSLLNRSVSANVVMYRVNATTIKTASIHMSTSPQGVSATDYTTVTVPDLDSNGVFINMVLKATTTGSITETATLNQMWAEFRGATR